MIPRTPSRPPEHDCADAGPSASSPDLPAPDLPAPALPAGPARIADEVSPRAIRDESSERVALTLISFGFKYGRPSANHYFDVSFLKNPAREAGWDLWSEANALMRQWVLDQAPAREFLDAVVPLARFLARADDGARIALGCSAGRHRSTILTEELARRLRAEGLEVAVHHRESAQLERALEETEPA